MCEYNDNFDVKEHIALGEELFLQLSDGGIEKDCTLRLDYNHN